ncbi:Ribosomal RNA-processing protein 12 [Ceratocystis lukuohia]|uniref:Ribosomal RNA-processing protein 12 n=1 Tax=Ceratocystis lukuohia TaxID=2019550 RepID=A0ABR4MD87_9PEZI
MATPTLAEKLDKIKSPGLQSQQKNVIVLSAVESTIKEQNATPTPTAYLAALLALLNQSIANDNANPEITSSVIYLLDVVTPYAPQSILRAKFTSVLTFVAPVLVLQDGEPSLLRSSIGCLESLLLAQDAAAWDLSATEISPRRAVAGLLHLSLDHRPKVRRRAQDALTHVLRNPPPSPSLDHPAADMCAHTAMKSLEDLVAKSAQLRKQSKKADAHDPTLIHALQLTKTVAHASGGWPSKTIEPLCELLLGIAKTGNEYMAMAVFDIFEVIFAGMTDQTMSAKLPRLMEIISELQPAENDTQLVPPWVAILSRGYEVSAQLEPEETFQKLPEIFALVAHFLESPSENIRISASQCLVSFLATCVPKQTILDPSIFDQKILEKVASIAESLLSVRYQAAWMETFTVLAAMYDALRWTAYPIMMGITKNIGDIRVHGAFQNKAKADEVIGKAIRAMGPEAVLSVMPLNLAKPVKGQPGRAWMMPLLRDYVSNTNLAHFKSEFVPLSQVMYQRVMEHQGERTMEIKIFETLVQQTWSLLPGYCDLPLDLTDAFDQEFAELLANLLYSQPELRMDICRSMRMVVESNQAIAAIEDDEDEKDEDEDLVLQSRVSRAQAKKNLEYLSAFAGNFLAVLFNVYTQTLPQSRGPILQTINAFLSITPEAELMETFERVSQMLAVELNNSVPKDDKENKTPKKDALPSTSQTLMDLVITMSIYIPRASFSALFEIASVVISRGTEPQLQKKAYKLIPRLAESATGQMALNERNAELQELLVSSASKVSAPARRERLAAISALLPFVPTSDLHFIPAILSEVVISCKENNERARETAYGLLVQMGQIMANANGALIQNSKVAHMPDDSPAVPATMEEYFTMVSAGLAGSTPHMISATITALSRILYEFKDAISVQTLADLVQTMDLFLTSNNREIVKSVLGFIKICVISLPLDLVTPRLQSLVPNIIVWSHEHKGHFKSKVRHILERMVRRFGYDAIYRNTPETDRKLIINIRKTKERSKKKKQAEKDANREGGSDSDEGADNNKFEDAYDQALYSSDSDNDGEAASDDEGEGARSSRSRGANKKGGNAYIIEDDDEPLDLLDRRALASISSTKPVKLRKPTKNKAKTDLDGKLILGRDDDVSMDIDDDNNDAVAGGESGVGAYVAALKSKEAGRRIRGGKLKFSNKRTNSKDSDDEDDEPMAESTVAAAAGAVRAQQRGRGGPRGGGGRGGRGGRGGHGGHGGRGGRGASGSFTNGRRSLGGERRRGGGGVMKSPRHNK